MLPAGSKKPQNYVVSKLLDVEVSHSPPGILCSELTIWHMRIGHSKEHNNVEGFLILNLTRRGGWWCEEGFFYTNCSALFWSVRKFWRPAFPGKTTCLCTSLWAYVTQKERKNKESSAEEEEEEPFWKPTTLGTGEVSFVGWMHEVGGWVGGWMCLDGFVDGGMDGWMVTWPLFLH